MVANLFGRFVSSVTASVVVVVVVLFLLEMAFAVADVTLEPVFGVTLFKWRFVAGGVKGLVQSIEIKDNFKRKTKLIYFSQQFFSFVLKKGM